MILREILPPRSLKQAVDLVVVLLLVTFGLWLVLPVRTVFAASAAYVFSPSSGSYSGCGQQTIYLVLSVTGEANAADVEFRYDPSAIDLQSVDSGAGGFIVKQVSSGDVKLAKGYFISSLSGQENYAIITFTPRQGASVASFIVVDGTVADANTSESIPVSYGSASYNLQCPVPTPPPPPPPPTSPTSPTSPTPTSPTSPAPSGSSSSSSSSSGGSNTPVPTQGSNPTPNPAPSTTSSSGGQTNPTAPATNPSVIDMSNYTGPRFTFGEQDYPITVDLPTLTSGDSFVLSGDAEPKSQVEVTVNSDPLIFNTVTGDDGKWRVEIHTAGLETGQHSFKIKITDSKGAHEVPLVKFLIKPVTTISLWLLVGGGAVIILIAAGLWLKYAIGKEKGHLQSSPIPATKLKPQQEPEPVKSGPTYEDVLSLSQELNQMMMGAVDLFIQTFNNVQDVGKKATEAKVESAWKTFVDLLGPGYEPLYGIAYSVGTWVQLKPMLETYSISSPARSVQAAVKKLETIRTEMVAPQIKQLLATAGNIAYTFTDQLQTQLAAAPTTSKKTAKPKAPLKKKPAKAKKVK